VRIFVGDQGAKGREVANKISNDDASMCRFGPGDAKRCVSGGKRI
jgi:hypothetical protein